MIVMIRIWIQDAILSDINAIKSTGLTCIQTASNFLFTNNRHGVFIAKI